MSPVAPEAKENKMKRISMMIAVLLFCCAMGAAQGCPWQDPSDCAGKCDICMNPMPPYTCYYCNAAPEGQVGFTCKVSSCNNCNNGAPICDAQGDAKGAASRSQTAKCSKAATQDARSLMAEENKVWASDTSLPQVFSRTLAEAVQSLQDWVATTAIKGTPGNPAMVWGHMFNRDTGEETQSTAINVRPGVWQLHVEKAIYGETSLPDKIVISNVGWKTFDARGKMINEGKIAQQQ
jgi:hypothetical protein